jgi:starch phosphorylase
LKVELYANPLGKDAAVIETMTVCDKRTDATLTYSGQVSATRAASDYTPRIVPNHPGVSVPLEAGQILWQR